MDLLGSFTFSVGLTTTILAATALWLVPYQLLMPTHVGYLSASISVMSVSCSTNLIKKGRLPQSRVLAGLSVLFGISIGSVLLLHSTGAYSLGRRLDLVMQQFPEHRLDPALIQRNSSLYHHLTSPIDINQQFEQMHQQPKSVDLAVARILWTIIYGFHCLIGGAILLGTIIATIAWLKKTDPERDLEQEFLMNSQDGSSGGSSGED